MKKLLALILSVLMICVVLAGCGSASKGGSSNDKAVELTSDALVGKWGFDFSGMDKNALTEALQSSMQQEGGETAMNVSKLFDELGGDFIAELMNDETASMVMEFGSDGKITMIVNISDFKSGMVGMVEKMYARIGSMDVNKIADLIGKSVDEINAAVEQSGISSVKELFDQQAAQYKQAFEMYMTDKMIAESFGENAEVRDDGTILVPCGTYTLEGNKIVITDDSDKSSTMTVKYNGSYIEIIEVTGGEETETMNLVKGVRLIKK